MDTILHALTGIGVAVGVAVIGVLLVAGAEVLVALRDPKRGPEIRARSWRDNLHHMLH
jgi:hypothetical protein